MSNGGTLGVYFGAGTMHDNLKKMIEAAYITQYPDLRSADKIGTEVPENEFQGAIRFIRNNDDGTQKLLEYIPLGDENEVNATTLYGLINQANGASGVSEWVVQSARNSVKNYFSIDVNGNLIVAKWTQTITRTATASYETQYASDSDEIDYLSLDKQNLRDFEESNTYEYSAHSINYKSSISKYSMPFNYLWAFLVCGRDEDFVSKFADLVLDSKIEISIYDYVEEKETEVITSYNDNRWESTRVSERNVVNGQAQTPVVGDWSDKVLKTTVRNCKLDYNKVYSDNLVVVPTNLDIWYMKYSVKYVYEVEDSGEESDLVRSESAGSTVEQIIDGTWEEINPGVEQKTDTRVESKPNQATTYSMYHSIEHKYTLDGDPEVQEKTDPELEEGDEGYPNFCTLYLNSIAKRNIEEGWLIEILESNADTVNMVDLTKYLFQYYLTGRNYGMEAFNFESLYPTNSINGLYGGTLEEQIWFALLDEGYSKEAIAGVLGNLKQESGIKTNNLQNTYEKVIGMSDEEYTEAVNNGKYKQFETDCAGYGLAQWTSEGRKSGLLSFAHDKGADIDDASLQIEYLIGEISVNGGAGGRAKFQMGVVRDGYSYNSWLNASTPEEAAVAFCKVFERAGAEALDNRKSYAKEFYDKYKDATKSSALIGNIELTGEKREKMLNLLYDAIRIANDDRYGYSQKKRKEEFFYDCSSLVYRLYKKFFGITAPNTTYDYANYEMYKKGSTSSVALKPGDVLWREGHVVIYLGNGNYVAAHTDTIPFARQISVYQDNPAKFTYVYRFIEK